MASIQGHKWRNTKAEQVDKEAIAANEQKQLLKALLLYLTLLCVTNQNPLNHFLCFIL